MSEIVIAVVLLGIVALLEVLFHRAIKRIYQSIVLLL